MFVCYGWFVCKPLYHYQLKSFAWAFSLIFQGFSSFMIKVKSLPYFWQGQHHKVCTDLLKLLTDSSKIDEDCHSEVLVCWHFFPVIITLKRQIWSVQNMGIWVWFRLKSWRFTEWKFFICIFLVYWICVVLRVLGVFFRRCFRAAPVSYSSTYCFGFVAHGQWCMSFRSLIHKQSYIRD